jgi:two-component system NarL family sensor kinase
MSDLAVRSLGTLQQRARLPLRWRVVLTLFAVVLSAFVTGATFLYEEAAEHRHAIGHKAEAAAAAASHALDREVAAMSFLAKGLSKSPALIGGDLKAFHAQLVATPAPLGSWFILWNWDRQIVNSRRPYGEVLPTRAFYGSGDESWNRIRTRRVSISDRVISPVSQSFVLAVSLRTDGPDGEMNGFLSVVLPESRISAVVRETAPPPEWVTTIVDRKFGAMATTSDDRAWITRELPADLKERLRGPEARGTFVGHDGQRDALIAFHRSPTTDFTAITSLPLAIADAPIADALTKIRIAGAILLVAGTLAGIVVARQVAPVEASANLSERQLRLALARYASLWKDTSESLFVVKVTPTGRFVFEGLNPAHERATGLRLEDIAGKEPEECLPPETAKAVLRRYRKCAETGEPSVYDEVLDLPGGRRYWQTSLAPVRDPETGRIFLLVGTARDVTHDREARDEIERSRLLLQATLDALTAHIAILDENGVIIAVNRAWHRFAEDGGYTAPSHGVGVNYVAACREAVPMDPQAGLVAEGVASVLAGRRDEFRVNYVRGDRHFQMTSARFNHLETSHVVVAHEDVTELTSARKDVRSIADRLLSLQEEERRRIAADLHDSTAQHIVAADLGLMRVSAVAGDRQKVEEAVSAVRTSLDEAQREVRTLSYLLYPPHLRTNGLAESLRRFVEGFSRRTGLEGSATVTGDVDGIPIDVQRAVLRVVQEALVNVHRHAEATRVEVVVKLDGTTLRLTVGDDGKGLPEAAGDATEPSPPLGVGIPGMEARIRQFGGSLQIVSGPRGTTVRAVIPIREEGAEAAA